MKKSNFKKAFALSALMAFVITGSAYAESIKVDANDPEYKRDNITVEENQYFDNAGTVTVNESIIVDGGSFKNTDTVTANESITITGGTFNNTGTINTKTLEISGLGTDQSPIAGSITATDKIVYHGHPGNQMWRKVSATLITPDLQIIDTHSAQTGFEILNNDVLANVGKILIESHGARTALVIDANTDIKVTAPITLKHEKGTKNEARIEVEGGANFTANKIIADTGKTMLQLDHTSSAVINDIDVKDGGNFSLQTWGNEDETAKFTLNNITVGDGAAFKTSVYYDSYSKKINSAAHITGTDSDNHMTINLGKYAKADFGGVGDGNKKDWLGNKINFDVDKLTINMDNTDEYDYLIDEANNINKYKEDYSKGVYIHVNGKYNPLDPNIGCGRITVVGSSENNTGNLENDLQRLAYVVKITQEDGNNAATELPKILYPTGAHVEQNPGGIDDGGKGTVNDDGTVDIDEIIKNPDVFGTEEVGALGLISWRNELDDMNKRLGELRDSKGEHGVWVRMVRGENDYKSLNSQYNTYQLGYDEKLSTDPHWTLGAAFSYTDGDGGYDTGSFEMDHKTFTLYGSKLNDDGSYIDIVGKYSRLNHDLRNTWGDGEYDANGYSIGVEVGKRFQQGNGFWIEPQAQLTYGHVGSANYTAGDIKVAQDGMESLIGRAGVRFGKDLDNGNIYLRASYLYDFEGETGVTLTNAEGRERSFDQDLGGGWCEVGIGTNINLSDATHLYFDIEKTYGGDITTDWKWNAGIRYSF